MNEIVSRQAGPTPRLPVPTQDSMVERAKLYATAKGLVPSVFYNNPGACLLAIDWAAKNHLDDLSAFQGLHVIDGKPSVSAALRVELATKAGFEFRVLASNAETASIDVYDHREGEPRKVNPEPVTVHIGDIPSYRFNKTSKGNDSNWTLIPADMLFAHVCRVADRRYVKTAAALIDARQDYEDDTELDITDRPAPEADDKDAEATSEAPSEEPAEQGTEAPAVIEALKAAMVRAGIKTPALLKATKQVTGHHYPTMTQLAGDIEHRSAMLEWIYAQEDQK